MTRDEMGSAVAHVREQKAKRVETCNRLRAVLERCVEPTDLEDLDQSAAAALWGAGYLVVTDGGQLLVRGS